MSTVRFFRQSTQFFGHQVPTEFLLLGIIEFPVLILALFLGIEVRYLGESWQHIIGSFFPKAVMYATIMQLSLLAMGVYQRQVGRFIDVLVLRIASGLLLGLVPLGVSYYFAPMFFLGRGVLLLTVVFSFLLISLIRMTYRRVIKEQNIWPRVLVLGSGERAKLIRKAIDSGDLKGLYIIGYIAMNGDERDDTEFDHINLNKALNQYAEENSIDEIVLAVDERRAGLPSKELLECKMSGVDILDLVSFFERRAGKIRLDLLYPSWLYLSDGFRESTFRRVIKRVFDITVVLLVMPVAMSLLLVAALAVFLESRGRGPVFYNQARVGEEGAPFEIYKLRSMDADAEPDGMARWAKEHDSRITLVGSILRKTRIDELPQLLNILKGDMSFVGPRPERPEFVLQLAEKIPFYEERLRVKPGLTGWAQISYPYGSTEKDALEKLQYDLYYVKNFSIFMDVLIMLQTIEVVVLGKGAH